MTPNNGNLIEKSWSAKAKELPQDVRAMQGVWLFLLMLGIFFASSILLFVLYVVLRLSPEAGMRPDSFYLPRSFVPSTILLVGVSGALEWSLRAARNNQNNGVRVASVAALIMGLLFMVIQAEGMVRLVRAASEAQSLRNSLYSLTFVLAFLHALHVVGGIVGLVITAINANRDKYDHERNFALRFCTLYWHFLDVVWVLLLVSFIVASICVNSPIQP